MLSVVFLFQYVFDAFKHLEPKNYRPHHLNIIIGYPKDLDHAFDVFQPLQARKYGAHHLVIVIGYPEHLDYVY